MCGFDVGNVCIDLAHNFGFPPDSNSAPVKLESLTVEQREAKGESTNEVCDDLRDESAPGREYRDHRARIWAWLRTRVRPWLSAPWQSCRLPIRWSAARFDAQPRYAPPPRVVYVPQPTTTTMVPARHVPTQATISRRLLRDINGNCFERKIDQAGTELRIQRPATECSW